MNGIRVRVNHLDRNVELIGER